MEFKDYYQTLGVGKTATPEELKKSFRKLARKCHPDVNPGDESAEQRFKEINEAYEVLGNPETRRKYDELGTNWKQYEQAQAAGPNPSGRGWPFGGGGPSGGVHWNVNSGGAGSGFRTMSEDDVRNMFGDDPFSDFFQTFFGGGGPSGGARPRGGAPARRGRDVEHALELTLEQAFTGVTERLALTAGGHARTVEVRIPAGVSDRSRVRVAGEGEPGTGGSRAGDLFLRVRLAPHPVFERKGHDLYTRASIPFTTAVLGGEVELPAISGSTLRLKVPETTQPGQVFRLKGKGMPALRPRGARGDMYATAHVRLPDTLTAETRAHFEALAALDGKTTKQPASGTDSTKDPAA